MKPRLNGKRKKRLQEQFLDNERLDVLIEKLDELSSVAKRPSAEDVNEVTN
jgi:hypothetical protein